MKLITETIAIQTNQDTLYSKPIWFKKSIDKETKIIALK